MGKNSDKDPNRPKRPQSAYFIFMADLREKCKRTQEINTSNVTEFTKYASTKWNALEEKSGERKPWQDRADLDKQRYEREMADYHPPPGMSGRGSRKKQKDPYAPKRPKSAYLFFLEDFRAQNKDHLDHKQVVSKGAEQWAKLTDEDKKPYQVQHQLAKEEYGEKMKAMAPSYSGM